MVPLVLFTIIAFHVANYALGCMKYKQPVRILEPVVWTEPKAPKQQKVNWAREGF